MEGGSDEQQEVLERVVFEFDGGVSEGENVQTFDAGREGKNGQGLDYRPNARQIQAECVA